MMEFRKGIVCIHSLMDVLLSRWISNSRYITPSEFKSIEAHYERLKTLLPFYLADHPELTYEEYLDLLEQRNAEAKTIEADLRRLTLQKRQRKIGAFSKPFDKFWCCHNSIYRTRSVGTKLEVIKYDFVIRDFNIFDLKCLLGEDKLLIFPPSKRELYAVDFKRDLSTYFIGIVPFEVSESYGMTALNNKVYFILGDTAKPSHQFSTRIQAWSEVPAIPIEFSRFGLCPVGLTEKLYVYQQYKGTLGMLELDLKTFTWKSINIITSEF